MTTSYLQERARFRLPGPGSDSYLRTRSDFRLSYQTGGSWLQGRGALRSANTVGPPVVVPPPVEASVVLATPTVGAATILVTTAPYTASINSMQLAICCFRRGSTLTSPPTCTDTLLSNWTLLTNPIADRLTGNRNMLAVFGLMVDDETPQPRTVTMRSNGAAAAVGTVLQCMGFADLPTNIGSGVDLLNGDPAATLPSPRAASSWILTAASFNGLNAISAPPGFTQIEPAVFGGTILQLHMAYDSSNPLTTAASYTTSNQEAAIAVLELFVDSANAPEAFLSDGMSTLWDSGNILTAS